MYHIPTAEELNFDPYRRLGVLPRLHKAALFGDLKTVRAEIRAGTDVNQYEPDLCATPIFEAALSGSLQIVKELVNNGALINLKAADQMTPLLAACMSGKVEVVKFLLDKGADIQARTLGYESGLQIAAKSGWLDVAELLINRGLDVNSRSHQAETALHVAIVYGGNMDMIRLLLRKGADVHAAANGFCIHNFDIKEMGSNITPLFLASLVGVSDIIDTLIEADADVNTKTSVSYTPLHVAALCGHFDAVNTLLKAGANVNVRTNSNDTPLYFATVQGHTKIVATLLAVDGVELSMADGKENLLLMAANKGHLPIVKLLVASGHPIDGPSFPSLTPLHMALQFGHEDIAEFLIEKGADIHISDPMSGTAPLGHACRLQGFLARVARLLVAKGVDINAKSNDGATPLHLMVQAKDEPVENVKFLVEHGANPDARHNNAWTPLHYAIWVGNVKIVRYLLTKVSNINAESVLIGTPLHVAVHQGHSEIVGILLKNGANVCALEDSIGSPLCLAVEKEQYAITEMLLKHKAAVNLKEKKKGYTPLFSAIQKQNDKLVNLLLDYGVDPNVPNRCSIWPIHIAANSGNINIVKVLLEKGACFDVPAIGHVLFKNCTGLPVEVAQRIGKEQIVLLLELIEKLFNAVIKNDTQLIKCCIQAGAVVNARNVEGKTPLHFAVSNGNIEAINILLASGADIAHESKRGESPIHIATLSKNKDIVKLLLTHAKKLSYSEYNRVVNSRTERGTTALHYATENNALDIVKLLIQNGAIYNAKNKFDQTPLELTTDEEVKKLLDTVETLFEAVEKDSLEEVMQILKNDESVVNARDANGGGTPLYWAVSKGHVDIANFLLTNDADYRLVTNKGTTPLHIAASKGNVKIVKTLMSKVKSDAKKADDYVDGQTLSGTTALHAASSVDVAKCLLEAGATYNILNGEDKTPLQTQKNADVRKLLKTIHELFRNVEKGGSTVLNTVKRLEVAEFKAVISSRNEKGQTLPIVAAANGQVKVASKLLQKLKLR